MPPSDPLPIWGNQLSRLGANPILTTANTGTGGNICADPFLWVINGKLYCFMESSLPGDAIGEVWMGNSDDGVTWANFSKISTTGTHYAHPCIFEEGGVIHCYMQKGNGFIGYRSSPVASFPDWSDEVDVFDSVTFGWHHMREFTVFKHTDENYYLLGITGDGATEDQQIRGLWCATLTSDWNTDGTLVSADPLFDCDDELWVRDIVEITRLQADGRTLLYMGATRRYDLTGAIGTYEIDSLTTAGMTGHWITGNHTFGLSASGWDSQYIHRMSAIRFNDQWFAAYDALEDDVWRIGFATMP